MMKQRGTNTEWKQPNSVAQSVQVLHSQHGKTSERNRCILPVTSNRWSVKFGTTTAAKSVSESAESAAILGLLYALESASDSTKNECRLSRSSVLPSPQLVFLRSPKAKPLMILVFRASANCPTVGILFEPQCKLITPNVFSRGSWLRFRVSRYLKPASFNILHTRRTATILTSHPFCDGGGLLKAGLPSLRKIQLFNPNAL